MFEHDSKSNDDNSKYKDIESTVRIPIVRLGLAFQFTWLKDESGIINSSFLISGGWQTNYYKQGCCCFHCKDNNWVDVSSDFYGVNKVGINKMDQLVHQIIFYHKNLFLYLYHKFRKFFSYIIFH